MKRTPAKIADLSAIGNFSHEVLNRSPENLIKENESHRPVQLTARAIFTILYTRRVIDVHLYDEILRYVSGLYTYSERQKK